MLGPRPARTRCSRQRTPHISCRRAAFHGPTARPSGQDGFGDNDEIFAKFKAMENDKILPNKILLSGPKGIGKFTFSIHFINYILSLNEENKYDDVNFTINQYNKSFSLMSNLSHPNLSIVNLKSNKKNIEIDQIRNIITNSQKSSFNSKKRFILVDNVEFLNINASNALLKILEEPPENIYFILKNIFS